LRIVGFSSTDGSVQWANVQLEAGSSEAIQIGSDSQGGLEDINTGQSYTGSANGGGMFFSSDGGKTSSMGIFINGTSHNTFQDAGWANGGSMSGFRYTLTNSKLEANQTEAGTFSFAGTSDQAGAALKRAGFQYETIGENFGQDEYRSRGNWFAGGNSAHFNVDQINLNPSAKVPQAQGNMHFGEHNPYADWPSGLVAHCILDGACR